MRYLSMPSRGPEKKAMRRDDYLGLVAILFFPFFVLLWTIAAICWFAVRLFNLCRGRGFTSDE